MKKTYLTASNLVQVLTWIESTPHEQAALVPQKRENKICLSGYHDLMMVPVSLWNQAEKYSQPGHHFDKRMYRLNAKGRKYLRDNGVEVDRDGNVTYTAASVSAPRELLKGEVKKGGGHPMLRARWDFPLGTVLNGKRQDTGKMCAAFYLYTSSNGNLVGVNRTLNTCYELIDDETLKVLTTEQDTYSSWKKAQATLREKFVGASMIRIMRFADDLIQKGNENGREKHEAANA